MRRRQAKDPQTYYKHTSSQQFFICYLSGAVSCGTAVSTMIVAWSGCIPAFCFNFGKLLLYWWGVKWLLLLIFMWYKRFGFSFLPHNCIVLSVVASLFVCCCNKFGAPIRNRRVLHPYPPPANVEINRNLRTFTATNGTARLVCRFFYAAVGLCRYIHMYICRLIEVIWMRI